MPAPRRPRAGARTRSAGFGLELRGPALRVALDREIERRLLEIGFGDGARRSNAIRARPALPEPLGRGEPRCILASDEGLALLAQAAQHRVDEALEAAPLDPFGELDRLAHRGMGRDLEEEELGRPQAQEMARGRRLGRERAGEAMGDERVDLAQAAQRGRHHEMDEGAVARLESCEAAIALEYLGESAPLVEHLAQKLERYRARRGARSTRGCHGHRGCCEHFV